ncbi:cyanoexosortase C [Leptolyngbya sp. FACHB-261]|uniref:cyanoexosortase C n=1 Tax=Leptolyngbya sp. FACHB-261 TaxID=2692806 RepID=UPI0016837BAA|nr:cyanoexosortase C [Leptolyngbya sp. FACHB-261]MBD2101751.1 cyanoexosortase C [Leptolyngbya sp. FACHB-261]
MNQNLFRDSLRTTHSRIVAFGLLVGLFYLPVWVVSLLQQIVRGSSGSVLTIAATCLAGRELQKIYAQLSPSVTSERERLLGHALILGGVFIFPFCRFALWPQALVWLMIMTGIALSSWGKSFFEKNTFLTALIVLSVYPDPRSLAQGLWNTLTPPLMLEKLMAWLTGLALQAIGQPATVDGVYIILSSGSVEVAWGCNGFGMACSMAGSGLLLGLFFKQKWSQTVSLMAAGIVLALVLNVPRIMVMTLAAVYWGEESFKFWHGPWGGQIFSSILFTLYYYLVIKRLLSQPSLKSQA